MNFSQFAAATHLPVIAAFSSFVLLALTIYRNGVPKYCHTRHILKAVMIIAVVQIIWNIIHAGQYITVFSFYHSGTAWITVIFLGFYLCNAGFRQGMEVFLGEVVNESLAAVHLQGLIFEVIDCTPYRSMAPRDSGPEDPILKEVTALWFVTLRCTTSGKWCNRDMTYIHKGRQGVSEGVYVFDGAGKLQKTMDRSGGDGYCP